MDWADEIAHELTHWSKGQNDIAAQLRKAKADGQAKGIRYAANRLHELTGHGDGARLWDLTVSLKDRASAIEKGME